MAASVVARSQALEIAVQTIHQGRAQALVTGPISKENLQAAGLNDEGHTEILQALARKHWGKPVQSDMLFVYKDFRMLLLTRHVPLKRVHEALSLRGVQQSLDCLVRFLQYHAGIAQPRLCVLGVNPHAGELDGAQVHDDGRDAERHGLGLSAGELDARGGDLRGGEGLDGGQVDLVGDVVEPEHDHGTGGDPPG